MMKQSKTYHLKAIVFVIALLCCFILPNSAQAQYEFNRSGHTASIDTDNSDVTVTINSVEQLRFQSTGRLMMQGGVKVSQTAACAGLDDVGNLRYTSSAASPISGLVGHWTMNDTSGTTVTASVGSNGTFSGGAAVLSSAGQIAEALEFDGADDGVNIPNSSSLENFTAFTLSAWIYRTANAQSAGSRIISKADGGTGDNYHLALTGLGGDVQFRLETDGDIQANLATTLDPAELNSWTHIAGTWDGSNMRLYIDSIENVNSPLAKSGTIDADGDALMIGTHEYGPTNRRFPGLIDDVRVYNRALSASEIEDMYGFTGPAIQFCDGTNWQTLSYDPCAGSPTAGDTCQDGSVFAGDTNLFVTDVNQSTASRWKTTSGGADIDPDSSTDGQANHDNRAGTLSNFPAFELCQNLTRHGHSDWYLPARLEMQTLYDNKAAINAGSGENFVEDRYWTSTENGTTVAYRYDMSTGTEAGGMNKTDQYDVRCARRR